MKYKVPFVDFPTHYHRIERVIDAAIKGALSGGDLIMRQHLKDFEDNIASSVGTKYAVGLNSGTDALHFSLLAADIGTGDEVMTVAHTFVATAAAIVHCGATPILIDIDQDFNMDIDQLEKAVSPRTKAVIPVHLNGRLCDMEKLMTIAEKHSLLIVEDAAQALGATFDGKKAGSFGITGCFSFYPAKILGAFGDAGILTTDDAEIDSRVRMLRDHGQRRATGEVLFYGYNSRLDNLQAAILNVKLKHLPSWIERRRELASRYETGFSGVEQVTTPRPPAQGRYHDVYTNYVIRANRRDELADYLNKIGVEVLISWPTPMHHHKGLGLGHFQLPETERACKEVLSLPMNTEVSNEQVDFVIKAIRDFYT